MNSKPTHFSLGRSTHDTIYIIIASIFIGTLCLINVINISRFITFEFTFFSQPLSFIIPVGIIPYPLTFLCTDIVSECYGKKAANQLVMAGLIANVTTFTLIWLCGLPGSFVPQTTLENQFYLMRYLTMTAIISSMLAFLIAQYLDVYLFHLIKQLTHEKHLWLRNNVSTMISQFVDTCLVFSTTYLMTYHLAWGETQTGNPVYPLLTVILSSYGFKLAAALLDTIPCYCFVGLIKRIDKQQSPSLSHLLKE